MNYKIIEEAVEVPVTLNHIQEHLVLDDDQDTDLIENIVLSVANYFENITRRTLINTTFETKLDCLERVMPLCKPMVNEIVSITYIDSDGNLHTIPDAEYQLIGPDISKSIAFRKTFELPNNDLDEYEPITIKVIAGYGPTPDSIPLDIQSAILQTCAAYYEGRGDDEVAILEPARKIFHAYKVISL